MTIARQDGREPPHADTWLPVRRECEREKPPGVYCQYPFCRCTQPAPAAAELEIEPDKARGEVA